MINLQKNTVNDKVVVTVTELVTLINPFFLFEFKSDETNNLYYCISTNTSVNKPRYDLFTITDTATPNPLLGQVNLPVGTYEYRIYEQTSSTNLNPSLSTSRCEVGQARITVTTVNPFVTYESANVNNISYIQTP